MEENTYNTNQIYLRVVDMRKNQVVGTKKYFLKSKDKIILSFDISQEIDNYKITENPAGKPFPSGLG